MKVARVRDIFVEKGKRDLGERKEGRKQGVSFDFDSNPAQGSKGSSKAFLQSCVKERWYRVIRSVHKRN